MIREEFLQQFAIAVKARFGEVYEVASKVVLKTNGVKVTETMVRRQGDIVAPVVYLDDIIHQVETGNLTMQEGIDKALEVPLDSFEDRMMAVEVVQSLTKQKILDHVVHSVINTKCNQEYLVNKPYREFLDLAVIYRVILGETEEGYLSMVLTNDLCSKYNISLVELEKAAKQNTECRGFFTKRLEEILSELTESPCLEEYGSEEVWVCSMSGVSQTTTYAACVLLYSSVFKELADKLDSNLFILPSSIYEVLVLSAKVNVDGLCQIVKEVNRSGSVKVVEILSDNVYYYDRKTGKVTIAEK